MGQLVFVPCARAQARDLRSGESVPELAGCAATASLLRAHGYTEATLEDAEFAALGFAGVLAVVGAGDPLRLVLAAEVPPASVTPDPGSEHGAVAVGSLRWTDVRALFWDEPTALTAVAAARGVAAGHSLTEALGLAEVEALLQDHDLLWFAPEELDALPLP